MASGTALAREGTAAAGDNPSSALGLALAREGSVTGKTVTTAALDGDETALGVIDLVGSRLGVGLSSLANIFAPDVIVIGGGVMEAVGELLLDPAREELRRRALPPMNETPVVAAQMGNDAGMIGAAEMALEESGAVTR